MRRVCNGHSGGPLIETHELRTLCTTSATSSYAALPRRPEQWCVAIGERCTGCDDDEQGGGHGTAGAAGAAGAPRLPPLPPELLRAATSEEPGELEECEMAAGSAGIAE